MVRVRVGDAQIATRQWGEGPPLLMLHGLGGDGRLWREQVAPLGEHYRMVAVDLRGFGGSDKPHDPAAYRIPALTRDCAGLADALGLGPLHVLGTSMGGFIAQALALSRPELCRSLVLCHTAARMSIPADILEARVETLGRLSMREYAQMLAAQALAPGSVERLEGEIVEVIAGNDQWVYTQVLTEALTAFDLGERVADIAAPTLVLVGESDRVIPPQHGRELAARIPGARLVTIRDAGHLSYLEQPAAFNQAVLDFLATV
ncbi:MAG TPA: alpha/beta fold hydrolase [Rhodanobacter sp.]